MAIYVGVNGKPKEVSGVYVSVNGVPKEVNEIYSGDSDNNPRSVYSSGPEPGETIFTTSGVFTVPKGVKSIDVFCVGGGGCGAGKSTFSEGSAGGAYYPGGGGGGGYTKTVSNIEVEPGQEISVIVGAGGIYTKSFTGSKSIGGTSSVNEIFSASGGNSGSELYVYYTTGYYTNGEQFSLGTIIYPYGGFGGSGGGDGGLLVTNYGTYSYYLYGSAGGIDGSDGDKTLDGEKTYGYTRRVGIGQGTTTRYFGESDGTIFSTGGCGSNTPNGWYDATANTGDGGSASNRSGASGVAIIRWTIGK